MPSLSLSLNLASGTAEQALTPPTVAPSLMVSGSGMTATLDWTASNKQASPGFGYKVYSSAPSAGLVYSLEATLGDVLTYSNTVTESGDWYYYVRPYNDAGEGPFSNFANTNLA